MLDTALAIAAAAIWAAAYALYFLPDLARWWRGRPRRPSPPDALRQRPVRMRSTNWRTVGMKPLL